MVKRDLRADRRTMYSRLYGEDMPMLLEIFLPMLPHLARAMRSNADKAAVR